MGDVEVDEDLFDQDLDDELEDLDLKDWDHSWHSKKMPSPIRKKAELSSVPTLIKCNYWWELP